MSRCKTHIHSVKNKGENCFICKANGNRTTRQVAKDGGSVPCCRSCREKYNLPILEI